MLFRRPCTTLLACACLAGVSACGTGRQARTPPPGPLPRATVLAPVDVGGTPVAVAVGAGAVWVADQAGGRLVRVDPRTRRRSGPPVDVGAGPFALAVERGRVWVAGGDGEIRAVDARTSRVRTASARVPGANGIAVGAGGVWVTSRIAGTLTRIDPVTLRADPPIRVGAGAADVVVADGAVWVANSDAGTVSRVDARTGRAGKPIPSGAPAILALAAGDGALWLATAGGREEDRIRVVRLDPEEREVDDDGAAVQGAVPLDLAAGDGSVWATDAGSVLPLGDPRPAALTRIDVRGAPKRTGAPLRTGRRPGAVAVGAGGLWVADPASGTVVPVRLDR